MDLMMGAGNSTPEHTTQPAASLVRSTPPRNMDQVLGREQLEASLADLADQTEEMAETGTQPDKLRDQDPEESKMANWKAR